MPDLPPGPLRPPPLPPPPQGNETSSLWSGVAVGDASQLVDDAGLGRYFSIMSGRGRVFLYGVLDTNHATYAGHLAVTAPSGATIRLASGVAWVYYYLYTNDANVDFSLTNAGYYRLVLAQDHSTQTVRARMKGPLTTGFPTLSLFSPFEFPLARIHSTGSAIDWLIDDRRFFRNLSLPFRQGDATPPLGANSWNATGTDKIAVIGSNIQCGAVDPDGTDGSDACPFPLVHGSLTSPWYEYTAIVFGQAKSDLSSTPVSTKLSIGSATDNRFLVTLSDAVTGIDSVMFLSFGQRYG